jgi:hypothetical protein
MLFLQRIRGLLSKPLWQRNKRLGIQWRFRVSNGSDKFGVGL